MLNRIQKKIRSFYLKYKNSKVIYNYYHTNFNKKVLISYLTDPLLKPSYKHANNLEVKSIVSVFNCLEFNVDICDFRNKTFNIDRNYDVIFGFGYPLENSILSKKGKTKNILYATGAHPLYSIPASHKRLRQFYNKAAFFKPSLIREGGKEFLYQYSFSDYIILLGNEFTLNTYRLFTNVNINLVKGIVFKVNENINFNAKSKSNFLWFGGAGSVHKGLDLIIEAFTKLPNLNLYVCGNLDKDLINYYREKGGITKNILILGFISINSQKFIDLMNKCAFVIKVSVTEAMCSSVLTCMVNGGLIPIISDSVGINVIKGSISIKELNVEAVLNSIQRSQELTASQIKYLAKEIMEYASNIYSVKNFKKSIKEILINNEL